MKYCPNCGKSGVEGMKFCPKCGERLTGFDSEEKQGHVRQPEAPLKERNWFERHLNWTMGLAWLVCSPVAAFFWSGAGLAFSWGHLSGGLIMGVSALIFVGLMWWVTFWAIKQKGRSPFHVLWLLVPFGFIVLLCLENKSQTPKLPELED